MARLMKERAERQAGKKAAERLLARRERAIGKLGADLSIATSSGLVFGASAAAGALGISVRSLKSMVEPSDTVTNPHYRSGPPVALYEPIELLRLSKQKRVEKARARCGANRKAAARKAADTRRERAEAEAERIVETWEVTLPDLEWEKVVAEAVDAYVWQCRCRNHEPSETRIREDVRGLVLNYLRHECSDYDYILAEVTQAIRGRIARDEHGMDPASDARALMHAAIEAAATEKWSEFARLPVGQ